MYKKFFKRFFDLIFSTWGAVAFLPIFIVIYIISAIVFRGKVFFLQKRLGFNYQVFTIYKFKTMSDRRDNNGNLLPDEQRLNTYGTFLRKTSLDEIPQIFNIFKGDLSIVGPRPLLVAYLNYYTEMELIRHTVKPGLTGLAQINGGNTIKWEQRLKYDIQYVHNQSFVLDVKIFLRTIFHLFRRQTLHYSASLIEERSGKGFSFSTSLLQ